MEIDNVPIGEIIPYDKNPRKNDRAVDIVAKSIQEFGFRVPIILDKNNVIIAGHTRLKAAIKMGLKEVPVLWADDLTPEQVKAFRIMDNKSTEYAMWDFDALKMELTELKGSNYDLSLTGFSETEIDKLLPGSIEDPEVPKEPKYAINPGEIWQLGTHRLLCGDSTNHSQIQAFMGNITADICFTDPPYNVNYGAMKDHPSWKRTQSNGTNLIENDHLSDIEWQEFVTKYMTNVLQFTTGAVYICMSNKEMYSNKHVFEALGGHWASFIIWNKNRFVIGMQDYQRQYEPILYGWKEGNKHYWCGDRNQPDIWNIDRPISSPEHPTMKPIDLCRKAIINSSVRGGVVLDLFGGSGSTLLAAEKESRKCYMVEMDPKYCSVIIERWENLTGQKAIKI